MTVDRPSGSGPVSAVPSVRRTRPPEPAILRSPDLWPRNPYLTLPVVIGLMFFSILMAVLFGWISAAQGIGTAGIYFYSGLGFGTSVPVAWILYRLDMREIARARRANERIGWQAVEADTARRIAEMHARKRAEEQS